MAETQKSDAKSQGQTAFAAPSISLPKGGGAIRGIGEKFAANPVTGTGSMTVPLPVSPGRSGFGPQLSLSYDSGSGNGPFGFGWSLSLPAITRKTEKGLPQYRDAEESDVYVLSGSEDLVPVHQPDGKRFEDPTTFPGYTVHRYRPRIEGLFARIERWTSTAGDIHWRSITRDNVTTLYGKTPESRIADPSDASRVFGWLICESFDDKGNAIVYRYAPEDDRNIDRAQASERNRVRTAQRYLKRVLYGNRVSRLIQPDLAQAEWLFQLVLDYDEGHYEELALDATRSEAEQHRFARAAALPGGSWTSRPDPFSSYRAGFELRTYRRCCRVLMFHRFDELGTEPYLVRATEFDYADFEYAQSTTIENELAHNGSTRVASFIQSVSQSGFVRDDTRPSVVRNGVKHFAYLKKSLPPLEFEYSKATIQEEIRELDPGDLANLPVGLDGSLYQWVDLEGEGISGILTEQADTWFYKPNLGEGHLGPQRVVASKPSLADLGGGRQQLLDLAGDGQLDLVSFAGPSPGFYERTAEEEWESFKPFASLPNLAWDEPNLRFVDLNGDGHADLLITEDEVFTWHPSLAEEGFGAARAVRQSVDEEDGPRLVVSDGAQSIYLADMCGDGLTALVRIRNGEVCYWPNLGYGRFGAKVTMDDPPWFDSTEQFSHSRLRLADIDGSGVTDIVYLGRDGVHLYFNQSGNRWSRPRSLRHLPSVDNLSSVMTADLLGNGTACLVWSSPLLVEARRPMRYIDLMGGQKPHLLVRSVNNLGAETRLHYASSTKLYLDDKGNGKPWITRLPFPVYVADRVETYDHISRNRFVTRYAYHHGYFDGTDREFRGFGLVEQWDTEEFAVLSAEQALPATNVDSASHVPPVLTRTWFHTGVNLGRGRVSDFFAGLLDSTDVGEYYRPRLTDAEARDLLVDDTILPEGLSVEEEGEACRALKGSLLRQEVYALDGTDKQDHPYRVTEQNFTVRLLQARNGNRHGVFFTHALETISYDYERNPDDPRVTQTLTLEVDEAGNVLKAATIGYGRRAPDTRLVAEDQARQTLTLVTYTENDVTNSTNAANAYRTPLICDRHTYELTGYSPTGAAERFRAQDFVRSDASAPGRLKHIVDQEIRYEEEPTTGRQRRLIEHVRTVYRKNDLTGLLPLGAVESLALGGESYKLAFTPGLLREVYRRPRPGHLPEDLLPDAEGVLGDQRGDGGGYVPTQRLKTSGTFPSTDTDDHWWIPSGRVLLSPVLADDPVLELTHAREHFFLSKRYVDPFGQTATVTYDAYDLLVLESRDAVGNRITIGDRDASDTINPTRSGNDYRVLQPRLVTDPNRNSSEVVFDAVGMVVATAAKAKGDTPGDTLNGFEAELSQAQLQTFREHGDPHVAAPTLLKGATTRVIYDLDSFRRSRQAHPHDSARWKPAFAATLAREVHGPDLVPSQGVKIHISFSYFDGIGREIQKKVQAEPGPLVEAGVVVSPRWVGTGWTIFNNKGKPVRQYQPFFSSTHGFEFAPLVGMSPVLFYDPLQRVVVTLYPNHTYEKVLFDSWHQTTYDVNDTVAAQGSESGDPRTDTDIKGFVAEYFKAQPGTWQTWRQQRANGAQGALEQIAAEKAAKHANTPITIHFDALGRPFVTLVHNGFKPDGAAIRYATRVDLDVEGNQRVVRDAVEQSGDKLGRIVMRYDYDLLGNRLHQASMEAGERWMLADVMGKPIRVWNSRGQVVRTEYDPLRRVLKSFVTGADPTSPNKELLVERLVYGEQHPESEPRNLRGKLYLHLDQAGVMASDAHDFKGNLLSASRRLALQYKEAVDWRAVDDNRVALPAAATAKLDPVALQTALGVRLEAPTFSSRTAFDALNRPVQVIAPRSDQTGAKRSVIQPVYNEAGLLERVHAWLDYSSEPEGLLDPATVLPSPVGISNVSYDAKGRRLSIEYKNGVTTRYRYNAETLRLTDAYTRRGATFTGDCANPQPPPPTLPAPEAPPAGRACGLQNLHYTYDPVGNITHIRDEAQQTIYFRNKRIEPSAEYTYDPLYRLIEAIGREHLGQVGGLPVPHSYNDSPRVGSHWSANDGEAMGRYLERYVYDAVGNLVSWQHVGTDPAHPGWTRTCAYNEPSLLEPGKWSNRLTSTTTGVDTSTFSTNRDGYDAHGNMLRMPQLQLLQWGFQDRLQMTQRQAVDLQDEDGIQHQGERTWYVYDSAGERVRKVTEVAGRLKDERIYLGTVEVYRRTGTTSPLVRETLHIMDDKQRVALVESRTQGSEPGVPAQFIRYQIGNHLGSAILELDAQAQLISYEEYTPYGSTSYQAVRSQIETPKRYRYAGKERDEESGLCYHGARYLAPWLARWTQPDVSGLVDGLCLYAYGRGNPVMRLDPDGNKTVHLTFDDGPQRDTTSVALDALDKEGVKATFYVVGSMVKGNEDVLFDIVKRGHFIGNHTLTHPDFTKEGKESISDEKIVEEFESTEKIIKDTLTAQKDLAVKAKTWDAIPKEQRDYIDSVITSGTREFRVPKFGDTPRQKKFIEQRFLRPRAANVDSKDAEISTDKSLSEAEKTKRVVNHILEGVPSDPKHKGVRAQKEETVIVLQHDIKRFSVDAIPSVIQKLRAEGHTFGGRIPPREKAKGPLGSNIITYPDGTATDWDTGETWVFSARP